jgi:hypothetical protein
MPLPSRARQKARRVPQAAGADAKEKGERMTTMNLAIDEPKFKVFRKPDGALSLLSLAEDYIKGQLVPPPHQRDPDAWTKKKQHDWIDRLIAVIEGKEQDPLGIVCVYSVIDEGCQTNFLNDGLQRISTAAKALLLPETVNLSETSIRGILNQIHLSVQYRTYDTHKKAGIDFGLVNNGTGLDPRERHKHEYAYSKGYDTLWKFELERFKKEVGEALADFTRTHARRVARKSRDGSVLQLFCVAHLGKPTSIDASNGLETLVAQVLEGGTNPETISKHIKTVQKFAKEIEWAWRAVRPDENAKMHEALGRWLLNIMFLHKETFNPGEWQVFLKALLEATNGRSQLQFLDEKGRPIGTENLATKLDIFVRVCNFLKIDISHKPKRDTKGPFLLKQGMEFDHVLPFADNGPGEMQPMPARLNAAKSARGL